MTILEDWAATTRGEAKQYRGLGEEAYAKALSPQTVSRQDALYAGLLALAPLIAGVVKGGKKNIAAGAQAGLMGTELLNKGLAEKQERAQKVSEIKAKSYLDQAEALEKSAFGAELEGKKLQTKKDLGLGPKGTTVNVNSSQLDAKAVDSINASLAGGVAAEAFIQDLNRINPEYLQKSYKDPKTGKYDFPQMAESVKQQILGEVFGVEADAGKINQAFQERFAPYRHLLYGAALTKEERQALNTALGRGGVLEASLPDLISVMERFKQGRKIEMYNTGDTYSIFGKGADRELVRSNIDSVWDRAMADARSLAKGPSKPNLPPGVEPGTLPNKEPGYFIRGKGMFYEDGTPYEE